MKQHGVIDVSELPTYRFSYRAPLWWGTLTFVVIEGLGFVFTIAVYFYLRAQNSDWHLLPSPVCCGPPC